jgi:hypothetical protein
LFSKAGRQRKMIPQYPGSTDSVQCHPPDDVLNLGLRLSGILRPSSPIETAGSWTMGKKTLWIPWDEHRTLQPDVVTSLTHSIP